MVNFSQRPKESVPDSSNLLKRKFENKAQEEKKDKKQANSQNLINQRTNSALSQLEELSKKFAEDHELQNSQEEGQKVIE